MKTIYFILLVIAVSCNPPGASVNVNEGVNILFLNDESSNILLNDNMALTVDDLNLYYYNQDMQYVHRWTSNLDHPNHILGINETTGQVDIHVVFGEEDGTYIKGGKSTTYLDFGNGDIDTIQVSGIKEPGRSLIKDVWYNGEYMEEAMLKGFTIIK